jgi:hypothetical protein
MNMALFCTVALVTGLTAINANADSDKKGHGNSHRDGGSRHDYRDNDHRGHDRHDYHDHDHNHNHNHNHNRRSAYHHDWDRGYWHRGHHDGRYGWWWITAGIWNLYPQPVYPYPRYESRVVIVDRPQPAPVVVQNSASFWYYCDSSRNYYPYVEYCPEGWRAIPTEPSDMN